MADAYAITIAAAVVLLAFWESIRPARPALLSLSLRWSSNGFLLILTWAITWALPALGGFSAAVMAQEHGWGVLNVAPLPAALAVPISFIALDLAGYWLHRLFHSVPLFWRSHALHHSDADLDFTTAVRHHPFEVLVQLLFAALTIVVFGIGPTAVALYAGTVMLVQLSHHANIDLPSGMHWLRWLIVTPELHRIHHAQALEDSNANFSNVFTVWDRLFSTQVLEPRGTFRVGLLGWEDPSTQRFHRLLATPWVISRSPTTLVPAASAAVSRRTHTRFASRSSADSSR